MRSRPSAFVVGVLAWAASGIGCGLLLGTSDEYRLKPAASGTGAAGGDGGGGAGGCDETIVYVAPAGDNASVGCSPDAPKQTLQAAIADVAKRRTEGAIIRICEGTYAGPVRLDYPVSLAGGYDCATWERPRGWGFPTFTEKGRTRVQAADPAKPALEIAGITITADVTIEGLSIEGGAAGAAGTVGLSVLDRASCVVSNNRILGGAGTPATGVGSTGVLVSSGGSPDLGFDRIEGGTGASDAWGSVGLQVASDAGSPHIHDGDIHGGSGVASAAGSGIGSTALQLALGSDSLLTGGHGAALEGNSIEGGTGTAAGVGSIGVNVSGVGPIDLSNNAIVGGSGQPGPVFAVNSSTTGKLRVTKNRIFAGNPAPTASGYALAVAVTSVPEIVNNMIHGGVGGATATGLLLVWLDQPTVVHNTIFSGFSASAAPSSGVAIIVHYETRWASIEDNVLLGPPGGTTYLSLLLADCIGRGSIGSLRNNVLGHGLAFNGYDPACPFPPALTAAAMESEIVTMCTAATPGLCAARGGALASGNLDGGCDGPCGSTLFDPWTEADGGATELAAGGWKLRVSGPCAVSQGGLDVGVTEDLYGTARTLPVSMGAHEQDGACM